MIVGRSNIVGKPLALVGIRSRGDEVAERVLNLLSEEDRELSFGVLDISLYRELMSRAEMVERFALDGISGGNAVFNTEKLDLNYTPVTDDGLKSVTGMKKLRTLTLKDTFVSDKGLTAVSDLTALEALYGCKVTDAGVELRAEARLVPPREKPRAGGAAIRCRDVAVGAAETGAGEGVDVRRRHLAGETLAADYLTRRGCQILERNLRTPYGEIDLLVRDGNTVIFVEVKTRSSESWTRPAAAVNARKKRLLSQAAMDYVRRLRDPRVKLRFDIVEVLLADGAVREVRHLPNSFSLSAPFRHG